MARTSQYTEQDKNSAVKALFNGERIGQVSKRFGVTATTLRSWKLKAEKEADEGFKGFTKESYSDNTQKQITSLTEEIAKLRFENATLKQLIVDFVRSTGNN